MLAQPISYQGVLTMHLVVLGAHGSYIQTLMLFIRSLSLITDPCLAAWISRAKCWVALAQLGRDFLRKDRLRHSVSIHRHSLGSG